MKFVFKIIKDYHSCIIRRSSSLHQTEESQARHETSDVIPMITVELLPLCPEDEPNPIADDVSIKNYLEKQLTQADASEIHFLTDDPAESTVDGSNKSKTELLEYLIRNNGSVVCKLCGEILQSRTHWYRHKYKVHIHNTQSVTPMPLFKCHQCSVFFKTRKGYIGHLASRHPDNENSQNQNPEPTGPSNPQLTAHNQTLVDESNAKADFSIESIKQEIIDPELAIPKSQVLNYNNVGGAQTKATLEVNKKFMRSAKGPSDTVQWAEKRSREEKLVADIIDRVRRECEATGGPAGGARKGYTRRTTSIMNT